MADDLLALTRRFVDGVPEPERAPVACGRTIRVYFPIDKIRDRNVLVPPAGHVHVVLDA